MKKLLLLALAGLSVAPLCVAQNQNDISVPEFRQALIDSLSVLDDRKAAEFEKVLRVATDETLRGWYKGVPDGRRFQNAVAQLKGMRQNYRNNPPLPGTGRDRAGNSSAGLAGANNREQSSRFSLDSASFSPAAGIGTYLTGPSTTLFTPIYPSGPNWQSMVNAISPMLNPGDQSESNCSANAKSGLIIAVSTFHGIKDAADGICEIIPDPLVVILGEGTAIPAKEICYGIALALVIVDSTLEGLLQDCETQNLLTSAADNRAGYNNSIALYNLKFRLKVEANLQNTGNPIGLFELPAAQGGYLEYARGIVKEYIDKMPTLGSGYNTVAAASSLATGDTYYAAGKFKLAYSSYRAAYSQAVQ